MLTNLETIWDKSSHLFILWMSVIFHICAWGEEGGSKHALLEKVLSDVELAAVSSLRVVVVWAVAVLDSEELSDYGLSEFEELTDSE